MGKSSLGVRSGMCDRTIIRSLRIPPVSQIADSPYDSEYRERGSNDGAGAAARARHDCRNPRRFISPPAGRGLC